MEKTCRNCIKYNDYMGVCIINARNCPDREYNEWELKRETCYGCNNWVKKMKTHGEYMCQISGDRWIKCLSYNRKYYTNKYISESFISEEEMTI